MFDGIFSIWLKTTLKMQIEKFNLKHFYSAICLISDDKWYSTVFVSL